MSIPSLRSSGLRLPAADLPVATGSPAGFPPVARPVRRGACWVGSALIALACLGAEASQTAAPKEVLVSHVGMTPRAFEGTSENDTKAAYRALNIELGRKYGEPYDAEIRVFNSLSEYRDSIRAGKTTFILINSWDFLRMDIADAVDLEFVPTSDGEAGHRWLLLVRRDRGFKVAGDLQEKKVAMLQTPMATLGGPWIETLLLEFGFASTEQFFGAMTVVNKPSAAVLPVFFGRLDACIVDEPAFKLMVEMNPQIGQTLEPIAQSEALVSGLIAFNKIGWKPERLRPRMTESLRNLHLEPAGRQVLTLFKCERLLPFESAQLETVKRLFARNRALLKPPPP